MPEPRAAPLTVVKGGIDRLRTKGGARADTLYDLVNAQIDAEFNIGPRPGSTRIAALPMGTVGLCTFGGKFHVFAHEFVDLSAYDDFELDILLHPFDPTAELVEIHFAEPFMGALYVVAEWSDGGVFHYWLASSGPWSADTVYLDGDVVTEFTSGATTVTQSIYHYWLQPGTEWTASTEYSFNEFVTPTTPNGFVYSASRLGLAYPAWAPGVPRTAGNGSSVDPSIVEPTVYNEFFYECIATTGDNPLSGSSEPNWPTSTGATIIENTDGSPVQSANDVTPPAPPATSTPQASTVERYNR